MSRPFHVTFVHPCIGRRPGQAYLRTWQMEPLPVAMLAALTPPEVARSFHDDRMEAIPFDAPTDLVAISTEVYTARRAYQIASEYRRRGVPVVMGGFHASLMPEETGRHAESVVLGEAEEVWAELLDDYRAGTPRKRYAAATRPDLTRSLPDRSIFSGRRYLPVGLVEAGRGCRHACEFCSIQAFYGSTRRNRPVQQIVREVAAMKDRSRLIFFVDDNIVADPGFAGELLEALTPLRIRWVSQGSLQAARDPDLLERLRASGCEGLLIGFESMAPDNLRQMGKAVNRDGSGFEEAMARLKHAGIRVYGTFVFGYDHDTPASFEAALAFAIRHGMYLCGFNHLVPMPGTPLYQRLASEGRLLHEAWWLDEAYRYNQVPFRPAGMAPEELRRLCLDTRRRFYGWNSTLRRAMHPSNRQDLRFLTWFFIMNGLHRLEIGLRDGLPLGDGAWRGQLLEATR